MKKNRSLFSRFFGVIIRWQTYLNLLYLLLALPLGIFYYIFLAGGILLGVPLVIIFIGILILIVVFAGWVAFIAFERQLAVWLLNVDVPPYVPENTGEVGHKNWISGLLANRVTWTGLLFLFLKLPLGVISFITLVTLLAITVISLAAPFIYNNLALEVWFTWDRVWAIDTLWEAIVLFVVGFLMIFISLHILNIVAWIWGRVAYWMLGRESKVSEPLVPTGDLSTGSAVVLPVVVGGEVKQEQDFSQEQETLAQEDVESVQATDEAMASEEQTEELEPPAFAAPEPLITPPPEETAGDVTPIITPPHDGQAAGDVPVVTPPPPAQDTQYIDEKDLPVAKGGVEKEIAPPEWLLEEEANPDASDATDGSKSAKTGESATSFGPDYDDD